eukprot:TRINITY_DN24167_c3_g1_i1.p1 TRINITY_DN24167_c3_g1~~TRINITY_DN24167_c3_g1_i1.p1  ORF type:complete len:380 (+),score=98.12 TRINITY_DN24167_c3_g1_i1:80-1141(+)
MFSEVLANAPVCGGALSCVTVGSLVHGMQVGPAIPFDIGDALAAPSLLHLVSAAALPFYCHTAGELVLTSMLLVTSSVQAERQWGSRRFLGFCLRCWATAWAVRLLLYAVLPRLTGGEVHPGPHFIALGVASRVFALSASSGVMAIFGFPLTQGAILWLYALQLALLHPAGLLSATCGAAAGILTRPAAPSLRSVLPAAALRPAERAARAAAHGGRWCATVAPIVCQPLAAPQHVWVRVAAGSHVAQLQREVDSGGGGDAAAGLGAHSPPVRSPLGSPARRLQRQAAPGGASSPRSGGTRSPSAAEIAFLTSLSFSEEQARDALRRSGGDAAGALEWLLQGGWEAERSGRPPV